MIKEKWVLESEEIEYVDGVPTSRNYQCSYHTLNRKVRFILHTVGSNYNGSIQFFTDGGVVPQLTLDFLEKFTVACKEFLAKREGI